MKKYAFRREDDGQVVWVDWPTMMEQDAAGFITLPDGVEARRCRRLEAEPRPQPKSQPKRAAPMPVVSDSLGFPVQALQDRIAQRDAMGMRGQIEFHRDPACPEFYQVHATSERDRDRYANRRNMVNRTGSLGGGLMLSQDELDRAAELAGRRVAPASETA